ncbi:MAG: hypothetical protein KC620_06160 [Myxococcales bacterium]|nr:hypothetical protein [Myxococcales bacterium]
MPPSATFLGSLRLSPLAFVLLCSVPAATLADVQIEWDKSLAFDKDHAAYERRLGEIVRRSADRAEQALGWRNANRLRVQVHTREDYARRYAVMAHRGAGAHYSAQSIHVNGGQQLDGGFEATMSHEMVHAVIDARRKGARLPTWLNEGFADYVGRGFLGDPRLAPTERQTLQQLNDDGLRLPASGLTNHLGYLKSRAAVLFLLDRYGRDRTMRFMVAMLDGTPRDKAMMGALGDHPDIFVKKFRKWIRGL